MCVVLFVLVSTRGQNIIATDLLLSHVNANQFKTSSPPKESTWAAWLQEQKQQSWLTHYFLIWQQMESGHSFFLFMPRNNNGDTKVNEVQVLLSIWFDKIHWEFLTLWETKAYQDVASKLARLGIYHTAKQLKNSRL